MRLSHRPLRHAQPFLLASALILGPCLPAQAGVSPNLIADTSFALGADGTPANYGTYSFFDVSAGTSDTCPATPAAKITASYQRETDSDGYIALVITLKNDSACTGHWQFFPNLVSGGGSLQDGGTPKLSASYRFNGVLTVTTNTMQVSTPTGTTTQPMLAYPYMGLNLSTSAGYLGNAATTQGTAWLNTANRFNVDYTFTGQAYGAQSLVPTSLEGVVGIGEIRPKGTLVLRLKQLSLTRTFDQARPLALTGLPNPTLSVGTGKPLKLSVGYAATAQLRAATKGTSTIGLYRDGITPVTASHALRSTLGQGNDASGVDYDGFVLTAPTTPGVYTVRYTPGLQGQALTNLALPAGLTRRADGSVDLGTVAVSANGGMFVGQHFHRYSNDTTGDYKGPLKVSYNFVRSLNATIPLPTIANTANYIPQIGPIYWWDGNANGTVKGAELKAWASRYTPATGSATSTRSVLLTFAGIPKAASQFPAETAMNSDYVIPAQISLPKDQTVYATMVKNTINQVGAARVMGVECWNEPDDLRLSLHPQARLTELADTCRTIYQAAQSVDKNILTFCPQLMSPDMLETLLSIPTTDGTGKLSDYCDLVGVHAYNYPGTKADGTSYAAGRMINHVKTVRDVLGRLNLNKGIALTEVGFSDSYTGWADGDFSSQGAQARADIVYQTLAAAQEMGVTVPVLYAYDDVPPGTKGFLGNVLGMKSQQEGLLITSFESAVNTAISEVTSKLGRASGSSPVALSLESDQSLAQVIPAQATYNQEFTVSISNPGSYPASGVSLTSKPASSKLVLASASGPQGSTCTVKAATWLTLSQIQCTGMSVAPGRTIQVKVRAKLDSGAANQALNNVLGFTAR